MAEGVEWPFSCCSATPIVFRVVEAKKAEIQCILDAESAPTAWPLSLCDAAGGFGGGVENGECPGAESGLQTRCQFINHDGFRANWQDDLGGLRELGAMRVALDEVKPVGQGGGAWKRRSELESGFPKIPHASRTGGYSRARRSCMTPTFIYWTVASAGGCEGGDARDNFLDRREGGYINITYGYLTYHIGPYRVK
jgi:hypothetical protein